MHATLSLSLPLYLEQIVVNDQISIAGKSSEEVVRCRHLILLLLELENLPRGEEYKNDKRWHMARDRR